jgi:thioesterase domain-containing protein
MVAEVARRSDRTLPLAALFREPTIERLAKLLRDPKQQQITATLIPLQTIGTESPLFCVHPAGGTVFCYQELARHFSGVRPVYGLQALGVDGLHAPHETLGEMAAHYARSIREVQPKGPYHLAGWSLGGVIAFEVARQICEQGDQVATLALFDAGLLTSAQEVSEADFLPLIMALFPDDEHLSLEEVRQLEPKAQMKFFVERAAQAGIVPIDQEMLGMQIFQVFQANVKVVHEYLPQVYPGKITLFRPEEQAKTGELFEDQALGWGPYAAGGVDVVMVPGDHAHMLHPPAVKQLASSLEACLLAAQPLPETEMRK